MALELLLAAAICHAGIAALPGGIPALNGLALRPWREATASVPDALLTVAGFGTTLSLVELLGAGLALVLEPPTGALGAGAFAAGLRYKEGELVVGVVGGFIL